MDFVKASFLDVICEDEYLWIFDNLIQAICRIDIDSFEMEVVSCYRKEERFAARRIFQDKFYLVTENSLKILVFDRKKQGEDSGFYLQEPSILYEMSRPYMTFMHESCIYFFPRYIDGEVICFELLTKKYIKKKLYECIRRTKISNNDLRIRYPGYYKGVVSFTLHNTKYYVECNLNDDKVIINESEFNNIILNSCCYDGKEIWLTELDSSNVTCMGRRIERLPKEQGYSRIYPLEDGVIIFPDNGNKLVYVEKGTFKVAVMQIPLLENEKQHIRLDCCENSNFVFLFSRNEHIDGFFLVNKRTFEVKRVHLKCANYLKKCFEFEKIIINEDEFKDLIKLIQFSKERVNVLYTGEGVMADAGKAIWGAIR